jgi:glycosyltransferase involved in cell wall biosynthesis
LPPHVQLSRGIFYHSPEYRDVKIRLVGHELHAYYPENFPVQTVFEAVCEYAAHRVLGMERLIFQSNCLGFEGFINGMKLRYYCRTIGMLHYLPQYATPFPEFPALNPYRAMDNIILCCDAGREYLAGCHNVRPYSVIYNGIEPPVVETKYYPDDGVFRFLFPNGWNSNKGFYKIIPAIKIVAQKYRIKVMVLGARSDDVAEQDILDGLPISCKYCIRDNAQMEAFYNRSNAVLFASQSEACPFTGIETMAHKLPIVSTNAAGLTEMFGNAALFSKMDENFNINVRDYADKMMKLIENRKLCRELGENGYARYLEKYTAKRMADDTVRLYESLFD